MRFLKGLCIFFGIFILYHIVFSSFFPVDENNVLQAPDWYIVVGMAVSTFAAVLITRKKKLKDSLLTQKMRKKIREKAFKKYGVHAENFTPPRTKHLQEIVAEEILSNITACVTLANKATSISSFVEWYDEAISDFSKLMQLNKVKFKGSPKLDYLLLKEEFQLHLCDAIVRQKESIISDVNGKYRNSREFQKRRLTAFESDVNLLRARFSHDTAELAEKAVGEIRTLIRPEDLHRPQFPDYSGPDAVLISVDRMEGHTFEYWCADLLRRNGFTDVEVTAGSGDQGVDVLALKDGIRYAIQCKCYTSDLGNKPVQEVNTGKVIYRCQIGVVMTNRHFAKGAIEAAKATGTLLWDREKLKEFLETGRP